MRILLCLNLAATISAVSHVSAAQDERCKSHNTTPVQCAVEKKELAELRKYPGLITRSGPILRFKIQNGNPVELVDVHNNSDRDRIYTFAGRLNGIDFALIDVTYWEGGTNLLVDLRSGKIEDIKGEPIVSPNREKVVSSVFGGISGYFQTTINIYRITPGGLVMEWSHQPVWEPSELRWINDSKIALTKNYFDQSLLLKHQHSDMAYVKKTGSIEYRDNTWIVE